METKRDLGRPRPWRESLERSRHRRGGPPHNSVERSLPRSRGRSPFERAATLVLRHRRPKRAAVPLLGAGGASVLAVLAAITLPTVLGPRSASRGHPVPFALVHDTAAFPPWPTGSGYVNPLKGAHVTAERIDQGVDYAGSGPLRAMGGATITYVASSNTGWPGAFLEYRLTSGRYAGRYVYYAEGVNPAAGLHNGERVSPGQKIAEIIAGWSSGLEIGWGAGTGTETYAMTHGQWNPGPDPRSIATPAGKSFSAVIASLGGPRGIVEG